MIELTEDEFNDLWVGTSELRRRARHDDNLSGYALKTVLWNETKAWIVQGIPYGSGKPWRINIPMSSGRVLIGGKMIDNDWRIVVTGSDSALTEARLRGLI